jgi:hypothetical protein
MRKRTQVHSETFDKDSLPIKQIQVENVKEGTWKPLNKPVLDFHDGENQPSIPLEEKVQTTPVQEIPKKPLDVKSGIKVTKQPPQKIPTKPRTHHKKRNEGKYKKPQDLSFKRAQEEGKFKQYQDLGKHKKEMRNLKFKKQENQYQGLKRAKENALKRDQNKYKKDHRYHQRSVEDNYQRRRRRNEEMYDEDERQSSHRARSLDLDED